MSHYSKVIPRTIVFATLLLSPSYAQGSGCGTKTSLSDPFTQVNATGQIAFNLGPSTDEDWYLTLTYNDLRFPDVHRGEHGLKSYLSIPDSLEFAGGVVFQFKGINASPTGTGTNGCEGVLSTECIDEMGKVTSNTGMWANENSTEIRRLCPEEMLKGTWVGSARPQPWLNQTCNITSPPGIDRHTTVSSAFGWDGAFQDDRDDDDFTEYDLNVRRPVPIVIAADFNNSASGNFSIETKVVCVAPDTVLEGSRVPEEEKPWESSADWLSEGWTRGIALTVAAVHLWF